MKRPYHYSQEKQRSPINFFTTNNTERDRNLAEALVNARYNVNNSQLPSRGGDANNFDRNAGSFGIFDHPNYQGVRRQPIINSSISGGDNVSSYLHSERIGAVNALNDLITRDYNGQVARPIDHATTPNTHGNDLIRMREASEYLTNNPKQYQDLLNQNNHVVDVWSERKSCSSAKPGGACWDFLQKVLPGDSTVNYIGEGKNAAEQLRKSYFDYKYPQQQQGHHQPPVNVFNQQLLPPYPQQQFQQLNLGQNRQQQQQAWSPQEAQEEREYWEDTNKYLLEHDTGKNDKFESNNLFQQMMQPVVQQYQPQGLFAQDRFTLQPFQNLTQQRQNLRTRMREDMGLARRIRGDQQLPQLQMSGASFEQKTPPQNQFARGGRVKPNNPLLQRMMKIENRGNNPLVHALLGYR